MDTNKVGTRLSATLVELVDLQLLAKQLHWTVTGQLFRPLHKQFDDLAETARNLADTVAERSVAIGSIPDGQAPRVASASPLDPLEIRPIEDLAAVEAGVRILELVTRNIRGRIVEVVDIDPVTQDVLVEASRELEEQLWMLRSHLGPSAMTTGR
ncbi:MAG: Dps family protein [Gaiellaceae bacterium]